MIAGVAFQPLLRGLFPRHLCAANASIFVHAPIRPQTAPVQAGKGKKSVKKIVQNCAVLCSINVVVFCVKNR
ncbi:hypothetical protein E0G79_20625 [Salmonella enterica]|nr:hypothetical protein [Salmonella enterica]ECG2405255.1 hypothetical protein [Salmonella enterica subsp. enterica serovar Oranienburg]